MQWPEIRGLRGSKLIREKPWLAFAKLSGAAFEIDMSWHDRRIRHMLP